MSRTILEPDVQARIDTFMAVPTEELEQRAEVEIMSDQSGAEFATLHEIKYCRRKERLAKLRRRGEPLPPLIWPLRATLPTSQRTTLDDLYVDASIGLPDRDEQGRRLYSAVMAAHAAKQEAAPEREIQPDIEADEGTESFASSLGLGRSRSETPTSPPPQPRRQVARRGKLRVSMLQAGLAARRSRSASLSSAASRSGRTTPSVTNRPRASSVSSSTSLPIQPGAADTARQEAATTGEAVPVVAAAQPAQVITFPLEEPQPDVMGSPARSEVSSTPGDVEPSASREPEPQMEPDPTVSKPASIEGDDELQALYDNHFKDKPFRLLPRTGDDWQPNRPTPLKRIARNDPKEVYYYREPTEDYDEASVHVQPAYSKSEPVPFAAWARCGFQPDADDPCYAPSQILSLAHLSQVGSMKVLRNMQNEQDMEDGKGPGGARPKRYQADFHPVALEYIAKQDAARKRDLGAVHDGRYPQVHCTRLPGDVLERGSFEGKDTLLSCFGYVKPATTYTGGETRVDDDTWISTTPIALQHNAALVNCALAQNNTMQYACDNVMAQLAAQQQTPTMTIDPLHIYMSQVVRHLQTVLTCQTAQLTSAAQHAKYMLRDGLTRCCDPDVRRNILTQPLLQGDELWEPVEESAGVRTFEQMMRDDNLRPAPAPVPRLVTVKDRDALGLASRHPIWGGEESIYEDFNSFLRLRRIAYAKRTTNEDRTQIRIHNPDSRKHARSMTVVDLQQYFRDPLRKDPNAEEEQEKDDADKAWEADDDELDSGNESTSGSGEGSDQEEAAGKQSEKKKKKPKRKTRLSTYVDPQEVEELERTAGEAPPSIDATCPEQIDLKEAYRRLGVPAGKEKKFVQSAVNLLAEQRAKICAWKEAKRRAEAHAKQSGDKLKEFRPRKAKDLIEPGHYGLVDPEDPELRAQLGLDERERSHIERGVPQDATQHARTEIRVKTRRRKPRKKKQYNSKEERELAILRRRRERTEAVLPDFSLQACKNMVMAFETDSDDAPPSPDKFEHTLQVGMGVPYIAPAPRVSVGDQPGTSGTQPKSKHRHDEPEEERIRVHPAVYQAQLESYSSCDDETEEGSDDEESELSSPKSSHDEAESDETLKSAELPESSCDSQVSSEKSGDTSGETTEVDEEEPTPKKEKLDVEATKPPKRTPRAKKPTKSRARAPASKRKEVKPKTKRGKQEIPPEQATEQATAPPVQQELPASPPEKRARRSSRLRAKAEQVQQEAPPSPPQPARASRTRKRKQ